MDIVEKSNTALRRIVQNDPKLTSLSVVNQDHTTNHNDHTGYFWLHNGADLSKLGKAIGNNTHLIGVSLYKSSEWMTRTGTNAFFEGLGRNTT